MVVSPPPRLPSGERLRRAGAIAWSLIGIGLLGAASIWLLFKIRVIFPPLVLALLIIYLVNPIVGRFERRGVKRSVAAVLAYLLVIGSIVLVVLAISPFVSAQVAELGERLPEFRNELVSFARGIGDGVEDRFGVRVNTERFECLVGADSDERSPSQARCDEVTEGFREQLAAQAGRLTDIGLGVLEALLVFILAPLIALYLLIDLPQLQRDLLNLVPENQRDEISDLASKTGRVVGGFFRGQLLVALIVGLLSALGFWAIGLPFWFLIGAIAGFFNLVPLVGPFVGGAVGFLVGVMHGGVGLGLAAAVVELIVQQIDNHFISPQVMSRTVKLHPATVILALLAGGTIAGFWGILLGVPAVAVMKVLFGHLWTTRILGVEPSPYAHATTTPAAAHVAAGGPASGAPAPAEPPGEPAEPPGEPAEEPVEPAGAPEAPSEPDD